jgi:hypothetical protein
MVKIRQQLTDPIHKELQEFLGPEVIGWGTSRLP